MQKLNGLFLLFKITIIKAKKKTSYVQLWKGNNIIGINAQNDFFEPA